MIKVQCTPPCGNPATTLPAPPAPVHLPTS
jgi:hypothetical protein